VMLGLAKALAEGEAPQAPWHHDGYRLRSGSWMASEGVPFEDVMRERFGDPVGRVNREDAGAAV
jgi:phthalate 4,5-dioxygenase